eukprot:11084207-Ditylum_brightwellii.AAC.1
MEMVLTAVMTVVTSTSHISHKQLIVVWQREASKTKRSNPNACVDDGKDGFDNSDDNSVDSGDKHLAHLTQVENNVNFGVTSTSLM